MTFTPIVKGTQNWDVPVNAAFAQLDADITTASGGALQATNNLSDLTNAAQARTNLGMSYNTGIDTGAINVKDHGALGNGVADDTVAIQFAIGVCPRGGTVVFPPGLYRISAPLIVPPRVTLLGGYAPHWPQYAADTTQLSSGIKALSGFTGNGMVIFEDKAIGGWAETYMSSARVTNLALDGGNYGTNVAGIYSIGQVVDIKLTDVSINNVSGRGIYTDTYASNQPKGWQLTRVSVQSSGSEGFYHVNTGGADFAITDMTYTDCWAGANAGDGWSIASCVSVDLSGCRSEFNAGYGYFVAGSSRIRFTNCDTDRSTKSGWRLECQGAGTRSITLTGCVANRDGANDDITPAGYAGFDIVGTVGTAHVPVFMAGCLVNTNRNDQGTGIYSPDYGLKLTYAPQVSLTGTQLNGTVASYLDSQSQLVYDNSTRFNVTNPSTGTVTLEQSNTQRINGDTSTNRDIEFWTSTSGKRWAVRTSSTAEAGSNAGSNFNIVRYDDSGTVIDVPITVNRATGIVTLTDGVTASNFANTGSAFGIVSPHTHGVVAWAYDPIIGINSTVLTAGTIYLTALYPSVSQNVTKLYAHVSTVASGVTASQNFIGLYNSSGTLLQSVNIDSAITSTGLLTGTITSQAVTAGSLYWVGIVTNATTPPAMARGGNLGGQNSASNIGLTASTYRFATNSTGQTSLVNITPGSNAQTSFAGPWAAMG